MSQPPFLDDSPQTPATAQTPAQATAQTTTQAQPESIPNSRGASAPSNSPWAGLLLNIVLPVLVLNRLGDVFPSLGPWTVLVVALCFPIYGAVREVIQTKKIGILPALGALNVVGTGGLAALGLSGQWFALKEAFFPLLIGVVTFGSAFTAKPFAQAIFLNQTVVHAERIEQRLREINGRDQFLRHLRNATLILAGSFFLSAVLNYGLALHIFEPLPEALNETERIATLNAQVEKMTWMGFLVIATPSVLVTGVALFRLLANLRRLTGLSDQEIFRS